MTNRVEWVKWSIAAVIAVAQIDTHTETRTTHSTAFDRQKGQHNIVVETRYGMFFLCIIIMLWNSSLEYFRVFFLLSRQGQSYRDVIIFQMTFRE